MLEKARQNVKDTHKEVILQTLTMVNSAFALVAALAWNEAVKALIDRYFPSGSGLYSRFFYAILVTVLVVLVTKRLGKLAERFSKEESQNLTNQ